METKNGYPVILYTVQMHKGATKILGGNRALLDIIWTSFNLYVSLSGYNIHTLRGVLN